MGSSVENGDSAGELPMKMLEIGHGSEAYREAVALRDALLRQPLGLRLESRELEVESSYGHFGAEIDGRLVACLICVPVKEGVMQIRQMAVRQEFQGRGIGRFLMLSVEERVRGMGIHSLILHSRVTATGFYRKLGYLEIGAEFLEVGIPHQRMEKILSDFRD